MPNGGWEHLSKLKKSFFLVINFQLKIGGFGRIHPSKKWHERMSPKKKGRISKGNIIVFPAIDFQKVFQVFRGKNINPRSHQGNVPPVGCRLPIKHPLKVCGVGEMTDLDQVRWILWFELCTPTFFSKQFYVSFVFTLSYSHVYLHDLIYTWYCIIQLKVIWFLLSVGFEHTWAHGNFIWIYIQQ